MLFSELSVPEKQKLLIAATKTLSEINPDKYHSCGAILTVALGTTFKDDISKLTCSTGTSLKLLSDRNPILERIRNSSEYQNRHLGTYLYRYNFN